SPATRHPPPATLTALQPRVSWDRVHNRLLALPGSQQMALVNGGTIPDTGQYLVYTHNGLRVGEVDEEFVYERRVGDAFLLGTNAWRISDIEADRVIVAPAEGAPAMVPFWRGEQTGRSYDLGLAIGRFLRELTARHDDTECVAWLRRDYHLDEAAARNLLYHVRRQLARCDTLPTERTLFIEASRDQLGDWQVILLSPLGSRLHLALRLALENRLRQRLGYNPQCLHHDDGILIRLSDTDEPILDILEGLTPENVKGLILEELAESPLFALRFRQNAARALLLPRGQAGKRAPLWLQRLRGRDLLQVARRHPDFPIVAETFRECLHDHLDLPRLEQLLANVRSGEVAVVTRRMETPSPFAAGLLFAFTAGYMYQYDGVESDSGRGTPLDQHLLDQLITPQTQSHLLDPRAVHQVERRLRGLGQPPRTSTEMAEWLRRLGDLAQPDLEGPMAAFLEELEADGRAVRLELPGSRVPQRWVLSEERELYRQAFGLVPAEPEQRQTAAAVVLARYLATHALVSLRDVLDRYPFEETWARQRLEEWAASGRVVAVPSVTEAEPLQWSAPENLEQVQRGSLALLRREVATCPAPQFVDFVARWQHLHPETRQGSADGLVEMLGRLEGVLLPAELWERTVLPARVPGYQPRWLDECITSGEWLWVCQGEGNGPGSLAFVQRGNLGQWAAPAAPDTAALHGPPERVLECLRSRGAQFVTDLAQETSLTPSTVRSALWTLARLAAVTNDRFDVVRRGEEPAPATETAVVSRRFEVSRPGRLHAPRRASLSRPEGRWALVPWGRPDAEAQAVHHAGILLRRYGIVARELAAMDPWMPSWRVLYEVLSRMELAGDVRRGYFVEGLSGAQFALPEAARLLQELSLPADAAAPVLLLHSLDPANLYGAGAPLDIALLDGGTRTLSRRAGNWLVLR
ncbi:MAG TPA: hypothetical protein VEL76_10715, partial [Gemmataceae bacterium]|nr:hypothetical protein [Gemmataceae bacterium]